ncbi:NERD domain-containing protein [Arthrobacter globiformis]|uniref:NERD domain-containing protein n=1 Tax=Arthrobacter globiformis TaxID=1665 RepID=A0A328HLG2_ARTGO|nr:NERD domain-containing protein [Arthrobacter globiformis]RAM39034.1 NERD domain-containing protein [Arthrobacter globiformis]
MGAGDAAFERTRLASERIARLKRHLAPGDGGPLEGAGFGPAREFGAGKAGAGPVGSGPLGSGLVGAGSVGAEQSSHLVAERLAELGPCGWFLLHDVHWPGRPLARLEHVLVGPGGVVVVSVKNWSGHVDVVDGALLQNGHDRFPAVETSLAQAAAVAAVLPPPWRRLVRSQICLTAQPELWGTTGTGIEVRGIDRIAGAVTGMPDVLDAPSVLKLYAQLGQLLTRPQVPEAGTVRNPAYRPATASGAGRPGTQGTDDANTSRAVLRRPAHKLPAHKRPAPPHYRYGGDRRPGTVLRVVGRSLVAGLVSAALLAPPLWLLWDLLPK